MIRLNKYGLNGHLFIWIVLLAFGSLCQGSCHRPSSKKEIFLAHSLTIDHPVHRGLVYFNEELVNISGGQLRIKIFPNGQLGSEREVLELLQIGSIAMTKVSAATLANFAPEYEILGVPYLFRDQSHLFNVLEGKIGRELLEKGSDYWLKGLCFYDAGSRSFYTVNRPVRVPSDLRGLKIRVMNHPLSVDMVKAFGGSATPMAFSELYTALQQGVVDGAENNPPSFVSSNHYEICKYYTLDEHSRVPDVVVISTKFWNKLSPIEKDWIRQAAIKSVTVQKEYWRLSVKESMKKLAEAGVEFIYPDKTLFANESHPVIEKVSRDPVMRRMIAEILEL